MIDAWWGLRRAPFANTPDPEFANLSAAFDEGLARLLFDVTEMRGELSLVTGDAGCGRTMLPAYVARRLEVAGANGRCIFEDAAVARLARRSGGIPRLINNLATQAMFVAAARHESPVTAELADDVADDRE